MSASSSEASSGSSEPGDEQLEPLENAEEVAGELVEDPNLRRAIELYVQHNVEQHLHLRERDLLPDSEELARFDQVVPGLAKTVANEWQAESKYRRERDAKLLDAQTAGYKRYQWFAFILLAGLIGASVYLFSIGENAIGFVLAILFAASVIGRTLVGYFLQAVQDDEEEDSP